MRSSRNFDAAEERMGISDAKFQRSDGVKQLPLTRLYTLQYKVLYGGRHAASRKLVETHCRRRLGMAARFACCPVARSRCPAPTAACCARTRPHALRLAF